MTEDKKPVWKENKIKYNLDYKKTQVKQIKFELNKNTDMAIIEHLEKQPNKQGYLKALIIEDMEKKKNL